MSSAHLLLAGPPGSGKSTAARVVAARLGRAVEDLDGLIEASSGRRPADILECDGEPTFRRIEAEVLESAMSSAEPKVLALGGGALTNARSRAAARRGLIVGLDVDLASLEARLAADSMRRPLLTRGLSTLLEARRATYATADRTVDGRGAPEEVADRVVNATRTLHLVRSRFRSDETRILLGRSLIDATVGAVLHLEPRRPVLALVDAGVPEERRAAVLGALSEHLPVHAETLPGGEDSKTWPRIGALLERALAAGCGRQSVVLGLGGGAVCDAANLTAHLLGRGAPSVLVPTTLLAQVDASVGGKCAVNHAGQRNSVGAFHAPAEVITDLDWLESLSPQDYNSGLAELVKMAILGAPDVFEALERGERPDESMVARSVELKAEVVERDPLEHGERRTLNLGHTLGHALEAASNFELRHGEAVSMGLVAAARASVRRGFAPADLAERIEALLRQLGLPVRPETPLLEAASKHFASDKKGDATSIEWIAIRRLGKVVCERLLLSEVPGTLVELEG